MGSGQQGHIRSLAAVMWLAVVGCADNETAPRADEKDSGTEDAGTDAGETSEEPEPGEEPAPCAAGTWDHDGDAATVCVAWSDCAAGSYLVENGTPIADRVCAPCGEATYSSMPNSSVCAVIGSCAAGTHHVADGSPSANVECAACAPGTFCAGGSAAPVACAGDLWDDDANPASDCVPWTACAAGFKQTSVGSATTDRSCEACASGTFSSGTNALSCDAWTDCVPGQFISAAGTASSNRICAACRVGSISVEANASSCLLLRTCAEILESAPSAPDGIYAIDVDGEGALVPFSVYCDMTLDGGGWTLLLDSNAEGPRYLTEATPGLDVVRLNSASYLPTAYMQALADLSHQVHLRTVDDNALWFTTVADTEPILRLRAGLTLTGDASEHGLSDSYDAAHFTGPPDVEEHLKWHCGGWKAWPNVYHACDNEGGLHLVDDHSSWDYSDTTDKLALFVR